MGQLGDARIHQVSYAVFLTEADDCCALLTRCVASDREDLCLTAGAQVATDGSALGSRSSYFLLKRVRAVLAS